VSWLVFEEEYLLSEICVVICLVNLHYFRPLSSFIGKMALLNERVAPYLRRGGSH